MSKRANTKDVERQGREYSAYCFCGAFTFKGQDSIPHNPRNNKKNKGKK